MEWIRSIFFFIEASVWSLSLTESMLGEKMLKKVWSYPVDFCIRFRTIPDNPT